VAITAPVPIAARLPTLDVMHAQTATPEANVLLSVAEVARRAGVSRRTVYREIDRGALRVLHVGGQLRIAPADFRDYLDGGRT
jgi:excisionase family DNA binding protein